MISGLYLITDDAPKERLFERVAAALRGGVRLVQYRDKRRSTAEQTRIVRELLALCREHGALLLVNDSAEIAKATGADGVHIGQGDGSVEEARALLGPGKLIGVSTRSLAQARKAEAEGADYIGFGSIFPTRSKDDIEVVGLAALREVRRAVALPIVALGGISAERAGEVVDAGADAVYCGLQNETNARNFPGLNFTPAEVEQSLGYAHARNAKGLLAVNTVPPAGRFALAGLSMGGYVALEIMRQAPGRVSALALLDTSARPDTAQATEGRRNLMQLAETNFPAVIDTLLPRLVHPSRLTDALTVTTNRAIAENVGKDAFLRQQCAMIARIDSRPFLDQIQCPTLVLCGREDVITPIEVHQELFSAIPNSSLTIIEECGHLSTLDRPQQVTDALRKWLLLLNVKPSHVIQPDSAG